MADRVCIVCSNPLRRLRKKYCSYVCRDVMRRQETQARVVEHLCRICGNVMRMQGGITKLLCSMRCVGENNRRLKKGVQLLERTLVVCKNADCCNFIEKMVGSRDKNTTRGQFCGKSCRGKFFIPRIRSKLHSKSYLCTLLDGTKMKVRSRWEAAFIKDFLEKKNLKWEYEPEAIRLVDGRLYIPDFRIDEELFVELKGYEYRDDSGDRKADVLRSMGHSVVYADAEVLSRVYGLNLRPEYLQTLVEEII